MHSSPIFFVFISVCVFLNVEGKAVSRRLKRMAYQGMDNSLPNHSDAHWVQYPYYGIPENNAALDWHKSANVDPNYVENNAALDWHKSANVNPNYVENNAALDWHKSANVNPNDAENNEYIWHNSAGEPDQSYDRKYNLNEQQDLEHLLNSESISQDLPKYQEVQQNTPPLSEAKEGTAMNGNYDPLKDDQVFLHSTKRPKSKNAKQKIKKSGHEGKSKKGYSKKKNGHIKGKNTKVFPISSVQPDKLEDISKIDSQSGIRTTMNIQLVNEHISNKGVEKISPDNVGEHDSLNIKALELKNTSSIEDKSDQLSFQEIESTESGHLKVKDETTITTTNSIVERKFNPQVTQNLEKAILDSVIKTDEDKRLFNIELNHIFDNDFRSFVFNPNAQPLEKFQECQTPKNESGFCRYVQHCMLPSVLNSIQHFMENVCVIQERFIGVCCPEFPVSSLVVKWEDMPDNSNVTDLVKTPEDCGVGTNTRIVGGTNADRKAWPWMVALLNNKKNFFCGGSLINNRYVLTAAHCTFGPSKTQIVARLGEYDFNDPREPHDDYRVVEIKRHGQYNRMNLRNDIALLKLEKPVVFNEFVKTLCFPEIEKDYIGEIATLAGWGHIDGGTGDTSDVLQEASFPIISNEECSSSHGLPVPSSLICAAAPSEDKGACNGDSGGPLMLLDDKDRWKVIGLVSWGRRGCSPKFPTAYTRVTHFLEWIKKHSQ